MTFSNAIKICLRDYVDFSGRASRSEYWWFQLGVFLIVLILPLMIAGIVFWSTDIFTALIVYYILAGMFSLFLIIPSLAVAVRRLHDIGRSGWWYFITFVPLIGGIWFLVLMLTGSDEENEYGLPTV